MHSGSTDDISSSAEKRKRLHALIASRQFLSDGKRIIPRGEEHIHGLPLSFAQERLWFLDQLIPSIPAYNVPLTIHFTGQLNIALLEQCLYDIVNRHDILRTHFESMDQTPVQVIESAVSFSFSLVDLTGITAEQQQVAVETLIKEGGKRPFELRTSSLLRSVLLRLDRTQHTLFLTMHHIVTDGWSLDVFYQELGQLYEAAILEKPFPLPELPIQYADFALWQRKRFQDGVLDGQLSYWKQHLQDMPPVCNLPTNRSHPTKRTFQGARISFSLPEFLNAQLRSISQREGVTVFMVLLATLQALLARYTSGDDIVVGTPIANRTQPEIESLIGMFVNTLVLRTDLSNNPSFQELLRRVRKVCLDAYANQDVPFERLVEVLQPERDTSNTPLIQILFAFRSTGRSRLSLPGLTLSAQVQGNGTAKFDLMLEIQESNQGYVGVLEYNTDVFDEEIIVRMSRHYLTLLAAGLEKPEMRLANLPLMMDEECEHLLTVWSTVKRVALQEYRVCNLFEAQVSCAPEAIAVIFEDQHLTYCELNSLANQLAYRLQAQGVGPDVLVGVCLERSFEFMIALLAILKAGGAYVPLDPDYPVEQLASMLEDAHIHLLLIQPRSELQVSPQLPPTISTILLTPQWLLQLDEPKTNLTCSILPEHLAYVIYTSGSTGRPKGAAITHRGWSNLLQWFRVEMNMIAQDKTLVVTSPSFDLTQKDLVAPLLVGGTVQLAPSGYYDPHNVRQMIERQGITLLNCTPSMFYPLLDNNQGFEPLISLRSVILGGEPIVGAHLRTWMKSPGYHTDILNTYGPTESTDIVGFYRLHLYKQVGEGTIPLGYPIPGVQWYVLDGQQQLVPPGVAGELYLGGSGLARGYVNQPALTADRFVPHPFSAQPGERLYRTGDLVRYLPEGVLEFLGRLDQQIKIRGYRIELGEIEAVIAEHPHVRKSVVTLREDRPDGAQLVAYAISDGEKELTGKALRSYLKTRLPSYKVPAFCILLSAFPLTTNGKIDRRALPAPEGNTEQELLAPRTPTEEILAVLWQELLAVAVVDIHDSFFDQGGHSLLAVQLVSRIRTLFHIDVSVLTVFESPTIALLSHYIDQQQRQEQATVEQSIVPISREQALPLSFAQQRLWFLDQLEQKHVIHNIPISLYMEGKLDIAVLEHSLNEIVRRHEILRTTFPIQDDHPVQVVSPELILSVRVVDIQALSSNIKNNLIISLVRQNAQGFFCLTQAPLLRVLVLRLSKDSHVFLLAMHHIVSDGWSMSIFFRELSLLYKAFSLNMPSPLPALPIQYSDFAVWQRQRMQGKTLELQLAYWKQHMGGELIQLALPMNHPRSSTSIHRGGMQTFSLSASVHQALLALGKQLHVTLFMVLLSIFQVLLYRYSGQEDIIVGSPMTSRTRSETEDLIGLFLNTLVFRTDLSGEPSFHEVLSRVRETALGAYAHQELPFERLVEKLEVERDLSHNPLFQVAFVWQNTPKSSIELPGLLLKIIHVDYEVTRFDITLDMQEGQDGGLLGTVEYNADIFDATTILHMIDHYQVLAHAVLEHPKQRISRLPLLRQHEWLQLLVDGNTTTADYPQDKCIHELLDIMAKEYPDRVAISTSDEQITYQELNKRTNQVAHYLRRLGVGPEVPVGLFMERSLQAIVGIVGVLKAGGAYVPLDPAYPKDRIAFMVSDSHLSVLLTSQILEVALPKVKVKKVLLDADWVQICQESCDQLDQCNGVTLANPVYIIYTSGSTGTPKGVVGLHRGILNRCFWMWENYPFKENDICCQKTSLSFVDSVWEIFGPLLQGIGLVIIPDDTLKDPAQLSMLLAIHNVARVVLVPSLLRLLLNQHDHNLQKLLPHLKLWVTSGESLPAEVAKKFKAVLPRATLLNLYGPSETSADVTCANINLHYDEQKDSAPPIGYPIANTQIYILDRYLQPVPVGIPGEIYIAGDGLARGYLNRPTLTAERFIANPFSQELGTRMYKTGDSARYLPNGNIEFLGRLDYQVKVRGHRIELQEIETILSQHPTVRECVVTATTGKFENTLLVAYVSFQQSEPFRVTTLRTFLEEKLPSYMIPAFFVQLETIPLNPNGKTDRRLLPALDKAQPEIEIAYVSPRNETERSLAQIWANVLGLESVGIHDNFFKIGGHSLLLTQVMSRIRQFFGVELPLRSLFEMPTVAALALALEELLIDQVDDALLAQVLDELK